MGQESAYVLNAFFFYNQIVLFSYIWKISTFLW